jgi:hypothetical protein
VGATKALQHVFPDRSVTTANATNSRYEFWDVIMIDILIDAYLKRKDI